MKVYSKQDVINAIQQIDDEKWKDINHIIIKVADEYRSIHIDYEEPYCVTKPHYMVTPQQ